MDPRERRFAHIYIGVVGFTNNQGKPAIVTGAARGIGRAMAERFGRDGGHTAVRDYTVDVASQKPVSGRRTGRWSTNDHCASRVARTCQFAWLDRIMVLVTDRAFIIAGDFDAFAACGRISHSQ